MKVRPISVPDDNTVENLAGKIFDLAIETEEKIDWGRVSRDVTIAGTATLFALALTTGPVGIGLTLGSLAAFGIKEATVSVMLQLGEDFFVKAGLPEQDVKKVMKWVSYLSLGKTMSSMTKQALK